METGGSSLTVGRGSGGTSDTVGNGAGEMSLMEGSGINDALVTGGMTTSVEVTSVGSSVVAVSVSVAVGTTTTVELGSSVVPVVATVVVGITRGPVSVGAAYGGSNRPNCPHALHGYAHDLTSLGAARIGLQ